MSGYHKCTNILAQQVYSFHYKTLWPTLPVPPLTFPGDLRWNLTLSHQCATCSALRNALGFTRGTGPHVLVKLRVRPNRYVRMLSTLFFLVNINVQLKRSTQDIKQVASAWSTCVVIPVTFLSQSCHGHGGCGCSPVYIYVCTVFLFVLVCPCLSICLSDWHAL